MISEARLAGVAALIFALGFVLAMMLPGETPAGDDPDQEFVDYYESGSNQMRGIVGVYSMTLAALGLITLAAKEFRSGTALSAIARGAGYLAAAAFATGSVLFASVGAEVMINDSPVDPGVARFLPSVGYGLVLIVGGLSTAAMIAAISADWQRMNTMPGWLSWLGYACAVILLAGVIFIPMIALVIWALAVAGVLLTGRSPSPVGAAA